MKLVPYEIEGWGVGRLWLEGSRVIQHELPHLRAECPKASAAAGAEPAFVQQLRAYFEGEPVSFAEVELDLGWCSPFQRALTETLRAVPYGEVVSYGELASAAGYPNAHRAAGTFCARNRFPLLLPCHRVVAADGSVGAFSLQGPGYKRRLLALEGALDGLR